MSCPSVTSAANSTTALEFPANSAPQPPMENRATSPWAKMFHGGASPEELTQFINGFLNTMISEMKRADKKWKEMQQEQKRNYK
ncbi:MAG: hypothetical protein NTX49_06070 [Chlamydiae bacterium]|nr:hypothetical protein [Chlamydiota bacterium]